MTAAQRAESVRELAAKAGFARVGIAPARPLPHRDYVDGWLAAGRHGEMKYLERWHPARMDPRTLLPGARSVIVVADNYKQRGPAERARSASEGFVDETLDDEESSRAREAIGGSRIGNRQSETRDERPTARVAQYAWGRDYHKVLRKKLKRLVQTLKEAIVEPFDSRICVDTAPLLEREVAVLAGIGWIGKNTMVLHQEIGSFFFLAEIITTLDLEPSAPATDHCGTCTRCLEACPTGALTAPYQMDATCCISYLTIEHRSDIDPELQSHMGGWLYGCDICQDVCPYNQRAPLVSEPAYRPRIGHPLLPAPPLDAIFSMSSDQYDIALQGSAMKRASLPMLQRNARIALRHSHPHQVDDSAM